MLRNERVRSGRRAQQNTHAFARGSNPGSATPATSTWGFWGRDALVALIASVSSEVGRTRVLSLRSVTGTSAFGDRGDASSRIVQSGVEPPHSMSEIGCAGNGSSNWGRDEGVAAPLQSGRAAGLRPAIRHRRVCNIPEADLRVRLPGYTYRSPLYPARFAFEIRDSDTRIDGNSSAERKPPSPQPVSRPTTLSFTHASLGSSGV